MDLEQIESLRARNPAWRLLRADNAPLILSFLGTFFVEDNHGATPAAELAQALDDELYAINAASPEEPRYPLDATEYLNNWSAHERGWLRRFYPLDSDSDEPHFDATPALERAYSWVSSLQERSFVATESRLQTVVELLRQMAHGAEADPEARIAELRRRADIDQEIAQIEQNPQAGLLGPHRVARPNTSSSPPPRANCSPTSVRSRRTSAPWTATPANRSPPGTAAKASCSPSWSTLAPISTPQTRAVASKPSTTCCSPRRAKMSSPTCCPRS